MAAVSLKARWAQLAANFKSAVLQVRGHLEPGCEPLALMGRGSDWGRGFAGRGHKEPVAGESLSLAGDAGARAARSLRLWMCSGPMVLHGAALRRVFICSREESRPASVRRYHTQDPEGERLKKNGRRVKNSRRVIKISPSYFSQFSTAGPRDRPCDDTDHRSR